MDKIWFSDKNELFAAKGGPCDFVLLKDPGSVEMHTGNDVILTIAEPCGRPAEKEGFTNFFTLDLFVPDDACENGIYVSLDDYTKRQAEVDPDDEGEE